jgi:hypothetical protein
VAFAAIAGLFDERPMNAHDSVCSAAPNIIEPTKQDARFPWERVAHQRRWLMKTITKLAVGVALATGAALATAPAEAAHVSVGIGVGAPGYYGYYAPRPYPVYAGCDPYYYDCDYYGPAYSPGYVSFFAGPRYHHGWYGHRGWHGGWHHRR